MVSSLLFLHLTTWLCSQCKFDRSMFVPKTSTSMVVLLLFVHDMLLTTSTHHWSIQGKIFHKRSWILALLLSIQSVHNSSDHFLSQQRQAHELLECAKMHDSKLIATRTNSRTPLSITYGSPFFNHFLTFNHPDADNYTHVCIFQLIPIDK